MSGKVYVIADLHFGHRKVAEARGFENAYQHDAALVSAWNEVVDKRDVVYVLGDVFDTTPILDLKGIKKLALGNHDQRPGFIYASLFSQVRAGFEFDGCLLTHIPVHTGQLARWPLNVHGHTHTRPLEDRRYVCVSVEQCPRMAPVPLRELIQERRRELEKST